MASVLGGKWQASAAKHSINSNLPSLRATGRSTMASNSMGSPSPSTSTGVQRRRFPPAVRRQALTEDMVSIPTGIGRSRSARARGTNKVGPHAWHCCRWERGSQKEAPLSRSASHGITGWVQAERRWSGEPHRAHSFLTIRSHNLRRRVPSGHLSHLSVSSLPAECGRLEILSGPTSAEPFFDWSRRPVGSEFAPGSEDFRFRFRGFLVNFPRS